MPSVKGPILNFFNLILLCTAEHNWFEAQAHCMRKGAVLKRNFESTKSSGKYHWTGFYVRKSTWIKIIGCFQNRTVVNAIKKTYIMPISSAGLCQEVCFEDNYYLFGIQESKCVCLEDIPHTEQMKPDACNIKCNSNNNNSYPVNLKFTEDCGGQGAFNVFLSETAEEENIYVQKASTCLAIQCKDKKFIGATEDCDQGTAQYARICDHTEINRYSGWKGALTCCKHSDSYLLGDVDLTDVNNSCRHINGTVTGPAWVGVAKEIYIGVDRGTNFTAHDFSTLPHICQKCNKEGCEFSNCFEVNAVECILRPTTPTAVGTTTMKQATTSKIGGTIHDIKNSDMVFTNTRQSALHVISTTAGVKNLQNENQTLFKNVDDTGENYMVVQVALPVVAVIGIGSVAIIVIFIRRKKTKENRRTTIHQNENDFIQRPGVHTLSNENCYVLEAAYSRTTEKTNEDIEDLYNESTDGEYDHLRDGYSKQRLKENTYDHVSCLERQESSDYDVTNVHVKYPQTDTTYDRTTAFKGGSASGYNNCTTSCPEDCLYAKPVKSHAF